MSKIKTGIIGATGYTGSELVRILHNHSQTEISLITSESKAGKKFSDIHPAFYGMVDTVLRPLADIKNFDLDVVFLALPHGVSMNFVKEFHQASFKIIDLSGDFRLSTQQVYEKWYGKEHIFPEGFGKATFGLPELFSSRIKESRLVANPGCYPTSSILGLYPLLKNKFVDPKNIIVDAKSGTTGAGVKPSITTHFPNVNDNFKPYALKTHRHTVEIEETLNSLHQEAPVVQFTPHLLPIDRGIIATIYTVPLKRTTEQEVQELYRNTYKDHAFVRVRENPPSIKDVRGSNFCDVFATYDERTNRIITISAIDNLVKGAAGQAVHNMNLMFGLEETAGLKLVPLNP